MIFALKGAQESVWILYEGACSLKVQELRLSVFVLGYERIGQWNRLIYINVAKLMPIYYVE